MTYYVRTGRLAALLPPRSACDRGSTTVHAAEERVGHYDNLAGHGPWDHCYPETMSLCGVAGWGEAGPGTRTPGQPADLSHVNCARCARTTRFQEATRQPEGGNEFA
jgi:hypothetical protein